MTTGPKLALYGLVLAAMVAGGAAVGASAGPIDTGDGNEHDVDHDGSATDDAETAGGHGETEGGHGDDAAGLPAGGLLVSQDGYTFATGTRTLAAGTPQRFDFVIEGPDGHPVDAYGVVHDRELHLIVVSADLTTFAHVHPERDEHGTWTVELPPLPAGAHRAFADFQPTGGEALTLGVDLSVPGAVAPRAPLAARATDAVDDYDVTLERNPSDDGDEVTLTVSRDGEVVTTEPYLGAAGHLVAVRDGDLAYLHVHPLDDEPAGPVRFAVDVPSAGTYGLYFDFAHGGVVRTASFVVEVER